MRKIPNTIWTRAENGQNPSQKTLSRYLWNPQKQSFGPREIWPWKWNKCIEPTKRSFERIRAHAMQKADKGGADYSPSASNIANNILGSGKTETTLRKSRLEAQLPSIKLLGNSTRKHAAKLSRNLATEHRFRKPRTAKHRPENLEQQNTSGSLRSEKSQTPSGYEPKTAKTRSKKSCREIWP